MSTMRTRRLRKVAGATVSVLVSVAFSVGLLVNPADVHAMEAPSAATTAASEEGGQQKQATAAPTGTIGGNGIEGTEGAASAGQGTGSAGDPDGGKQDTEGQQENAAGNENTADASAKASVGAETETAMDGTTGGSIGGNADGNAGNDGSDIGKNEGKAASDGSDGSGNAGGNENNAGTMRRLPARAATQQTPSNGKKITDANNDGKDDTTGRIIIPCLPSGSNAYDKVNKWEWAKDEKSGYDREMYDHWKETFGDIKSSQYCWFDFKNLVNAPENKMDNYGIVNDAVEDETTHAIGEQTGAKAIPVVFELNESEWLTADIRMAASDRTPAGFIKLLCGKKSDTDVWTRASAIPNAYGFSDSSCESLLASNWGGYGTHSIMIDNMKSNILYDYRMTFADSEVMSSEERTVVDTDTSFDYDFVCSAYDYKCKTNGSVYSGGMYVNDSKSLIDFRGGGNHVPWNGGFNMADDTSHGAIIASTSVIPNHMQVNMTKTVSQIALGLRLPTFLLDNARLIYDGNGAQSGYMTGTNGAWDSAQDVKWNSAGYSDNPFTYVRKAADGTGTRMAFVGWNTNKDDPTKGTWYCDGKNANDAGTGGTASQAYGKEYEKWKDGIAACNTTISLSRANDVLDGTGDGTITLYAQWLPMTVMKEMPMTGSHGILVVLGIIGMAGIAIIMIRIRKAKLDALPALLASHRERHSPESK